MGFVYEKPDYYTDKAKKMGFPARSVFKLEEIDKKYGICKAGRKILDIGAAPGSWSLYCLHAMKGDCTLVAVDIKPIEDKRLVQNGSVHLIRGDIQDAAIQQNIAEFGPFDAILSDAAPNTTGNKTVDCGRSHTLVRRILLSCLPRLREGGDAVFKVFQGSGEEELFRELQAEFSKVKRTKPKAVRKNSFETFFICMNKISPLSSV